MAWIESHQAVLGHPKTRRLCRSLQCKPVTAIGHLHALWWWALDYAQDGTLDGYEPADIADAALWEDDPEQFFEALVSSGYVDRDDSGTRLHDWWEYAGKLIQRRKDDVERKRKQAEKAGIPTGNGTPSNTFPAELQRNSHGPLQEVAEVPYVTNQPTNQPTDHKAAQAPFLSILPKEATFSELSEHEQVASILGGRAGGKTADLSIGKAIRDRPRIDPVDVALNYERWQESERQAKAGGKKSAKVHEDPVRGWANAMKRADTKGFSLRPEMIARPSVLITQSSVPEWNGAAARLSQELGGNDFVRLIAPLKPTPPQGDTMVIVCPTVEHRDEVKDRFSGRISRTLEAVCHHDIFPEFVVAGWQS